MDDKARIRVWALGAAALLMVVALAAKASPAQAAARRPAPWDFSPGVVAVQADKLDRKSTRLNSSHRT